MRRNIGNEPSWSACSIRQITLAVVPTFFASSRWLSPAFLRSGFNVDDFLIQHRLAFRIIADELVNELI